MANIETDQKFLVGSDKAQGLALTRVAEGRRLGSMHGPQRFALWARAKEREAI